MTDELETLHSIETKADRATVQELRRMIQDAERLLPSLDAEGQAFAEALVLKLERLLGDQLAQRVRQAPSYVGWSLDGVPVFGITAPARLS
jgi:hypothetical protein